MKRVPHFVSFAGEEGFRGACVVEAFDVLDAASICHRLGINPGGEVLAVPIPEGADELTWERNRLFTDLDELRAKGLKPLREWEAEADEAD